MALAVGGAVLAAAAGCGHAPHPSTAGKSTVSHSATTRTAAVSRAAPG